MEHINPTQDWGVSGGVPRNATVALKNGWLPLGESGSWEINSIGWVRGDRRNYLIAVLTAHDPGEQYGIDTIEQHLFTGLRRPAALQGATRGADASRPAVFSDGLGAARQPGLKRSSRPAHKGSDGSRLQ